MIRLLCNMLLVLLLAAFVLLPASANHSTVGQQDEQSIGNGYYYLIAPNGQILCKDNKDVYTSDDYTAASIMYVCEDADGYNVVFADDKRLLTAKEADNADDVSLSAECWNGQQGQRFQLKAIDDSDHYMLQTDDAHVVVADDFTGELEVAEYSDSNKQVWTIKAAMNSNTLPTVAVELESTENWVDKDDTRFGQLTYTDAENNVCFTREISIRFQGHSSLEYPKKNYTIKFQEEGYEVVPSWGEQKEYCLKANYVDPTHAGNVVSTNLAAQINKSYDLYTDTPNYGQVDGFPVWMTINGEDIGLYTWNIPKDEWMLGMDKDNPNHLLMASEGWQKENLMLDENYELGKDWSIEVGAEDEVTAEAFARLVHFVVTADDETFRRDIGEYLNLDACLNYYCYICIANATDNTSNNVLLATWDGEIWSPLLYDLDSCWGIRPAGLEPVYALVYSRDEYNCRLLERIRDLFPEELKTRYAELRSTVLDQENIENAFNAFVEQIPAEYYLKDWQMWNPDGIYVQSLDLMQKRINEYLPEVDAAFGYCQ